MAWNENLTNLNDVLAGLYVTVKQSMRVVDDAGLPKGLIDFSDRALDNWHAILIEAERRGKVSEVIRVARKEYPDDPALKLAEQGTLAPVKGPRVDDDLPWKGTRDADTVERLMGAQSTLLPISFLEVGVERARSVVRIRLANGTLGTGFLVQKNLIVTNNHVIANPQEAKNAIVQFNYQLDPRGNAFEPTEFRFDPDAGFVTSPLDKTETDPNKNDWTVVRLQGDANQAWGAIELEPVDLTGIQWVNIIQHPSGAPKQIALYHNMVEFVDDRRVQYLTDTLPGSSGSPVFDSQWRLVALHHSGGWIREPESKKQVFRNEGINVNIILKGLEGTGLL